MVSVSVVVGIKNGKKNVFVKQNNKYGANKIGSFFSALILLFSNEMLVDNEMVGFIG
tara:strand:+ start:211 stop:381 length:171 start_codon:yes stop_codon:yes gene_type:complete